MYDIIVYQKFLLYIDKGILLVKDDVMLACIHLDTVSLTYEASFDVAKCIIDYRLCTVKSIKLELYFLHLLTKHLTFLM